MSVFLLGTICLRAVLLSIRALSGCDTLAGSDCGQEDGVIRRSQRNLLQGA